MNPGVHPMRWGYGIDSTCIILDGDPGAHLTMWRSWCASNDDNY